MKVIFLLIIGCTLLINDSLAQINTPPPRAAGPAKVEYSESVPYSPRIFPAAAKKKAGEQNKAKTPDAAVSGENKPFSLHVSVLEANTKKVEGLGKEDFRLFVDGTEQVISSVERADGPVNFIFLIDTSPSASDPGKSMLAVALKVAGQLAPQDAAMIVRFDGESRIVSELSSNKEVIEKAIEKAAAHKGNGTSLYDAVRKLAVDVLPRIPGRRAVLLFTDGVDTTSRAARYETSLELAETSDAEFYPIYFETLQTTLDTIKAQRLPDLPFRLPPGFKRSTQPEMILDYETGKVYLNDLIFLSGGRATLAQNVMGVPGADEVNVPAELKHSYKLTFTPSVQSFPGQRRQVVVRVDRPNLAVATRGSYIVSPN